MNVLKRPMFFAAALCSITATVALFNSNVAYVVGFIALVLCFFIYCKLDKKIITVLIAVVLFLISLFCEQSKIEKINKFDAQKTSGKFLVVSEPTVYENFNIITLQSVNNKRFTNTKFLAFDYTGADVSGGDIVNATLKISKIKPNDEYRLYDYGNGIYATANVVKIKKTNSANKLYKFAQSIRNYVKNTLSLRFGGDVSGLLVALTTGDKTLLSDNFLNNVKTTGISHIIVVSGMHLSIIMSAVFTLVDRFFYNKYLRSFLCVLSVIVITAVCGFTMSVLRAGAMFIIAGLAPIFKRESDIFSSLFTAITLVLIFSPFAIANISFQLSALSTYAIIWAAPFATQITVKKIKILPKFSQILFNIIYASIFALIFTLPITIKTFGFVSIVSIFTNVLVTYPVTIVLVVNIVALILSAIPIVNIVSNFLFFIVSLISKLILYIVNKIANLPITVAVLPKHFVLYSVVFILAIIVSFILYNQKIIKEKK